MKKFFAITCVLFACFTIQAQTKHLALNDTVTICQYVNGVRTYLSINNGNIVTSTEPNDNSLWIISHASYANYNWGDQDQYNFQHLQTGKFLHAEGGGSRWYYYANLSLGENPSLFIENNPAGENNNYTTANELHYSCVISNNTRAFSLTVYNGAWSLRENNSTTIRIEKWTKQATAEIVGYFNPAKYEFTYAKTDQEAEKQNQPVRFVFDLHEIEYMDCICRNDEPKLLSKSILISDLNTLKETYKIKPTYHWESSNDTDSKDSKITLSNYSSYDSGIADKQTILTYSGGENISDDDLAYELAITPIGPSPMGLKKDYGNNIVLWVDYVDRLVATCSYKGKEYKSSMRVVRKAYHQKDFPFVEFSVSPSTYTFGSLGGSQTFTIDATHQHGYAIYNVDEQMVAESAIYTENPEKITFGENSKWTCNLTSADDMSWLPPTELDENNQTTITVGQNNTNKYRLATITATVTLKENNDPNHDHPAQSTTIKIAQRTGQGQIEFQHKGGDSPQKVHQAEKTIYHLPGEEVYLRLPENNFQGYMRWYDFETGGNPRYNATKSKTTWKEVPRGTGGNFLEINTTDGQSHGLYATNDANYGDGILGDNQNTNNTPIIYGWSDEQHHTIACDVSAYTDYSITYNNGQKDKIVEPTLSYRQLFHLRPASEIAQKMHEVSLNVDECKGLENYHYQAPIKQDILLTTEYRYHNYQYHISEMCYFYGKDGTMDNLARVDESTKVRWYVYDGEVDPKEPRNKYTFTEFSPQYTSEKDFVVVTSDIPCTKTYQLRVLEEDNRTKGLQHDLYIAQFVVDFVDHNTHGPTTSELISLQEIKSNYQLLKEINFNDQYTQPLDWENTTYGFTYPPGHTPNYVRPVNGEFPFYGEYCLLNQITGKSWLQDIANHGGADKGYAMYVDGTMEPGLVASISTDVPICTGQTMYCSMWLCNPLKVDDNSRANPIFRCNVQGFNEENETWEDAGVFFVGELTNRQGWNQIMFPIKSAQSYKATRVSIYNFATTNNGNDFLIDDIYLFASPLPMAAYHAKMACRTIENGESSAAAILRLDYSKMQQSDGYIYYQIFNQTDGRIIELKEEKTNNQYESAYLHDNNLDESPEYGSVIIPESDYIPTESDAQYLSISKFLDDLVLNGKRHGKAYIKTTNNGVTKWLLYVAHIIPYAHIPDAGQQLVVDDANEDVLLDEKKEYFIRMAYSPRELSLADCNMQAPLHATHKTILNLTAIHNGESEDFDDEKDDLCANEMYLLQAKVQNRFITEPGGTTSVNLEGTILCDWLVGSDFDDKDYSVGDTPVDTLFKKKYGYTRGQIATAIIHDMRRFPTVEEPNPNWSATSFSQVNPQYFEDRNNYLIVQHLVEEGWLDLAKKTKRVYLGSQDVARFWVYPIEGTAKAKYDNKDVELHDCPEARWLKISSSSSNYGFSIQPTLENDEEIPVEFELPRLRMLRSQQNQGVDIPITHPATINEQVGVTDAKIYSTSDPEFTDINSYSCPCTIDIHDKKITLNLKSKTWPDFTIGEDYTISIGIKNGDATSDGQCPYGTIYFDLILLPDTVVWTPHQGLFNGWGIDENWQAWTDKNKDNKIDASELSVGFTPMHGSNVIIPVMNNDALYPSIQEHNHYPADIHFSPFTCGKIYFAAGTRIINQHLLQHEQAFVDMIIPAAGWYLMSAPLQDMYSGDMFIPHSGDSYDDSNAKNMESTKPFHVETFQGTRSGSAPYAFWASYYNQTIKHWYQDGSSKTQETNLAEFLQSNSLQEPLTPGKGFALWGEGLGEEKLTIRLPKSDNHYIATGGLSVPITRTNGTHLAFTATPENPQMTINLTNQTSSEYFLFGNPTMALIDLQKLCKDHEQLSGEFYHMDNSTWKPATPLTLTPAERYLPPMTSVLLKTKNAAQNLSITLEPSHLVLDPTINPMSEDASTPSSLSARRTPISDKRYPTSADETSQLMTIYAFTESAYARTILATNPAANDYYTSGEDALFISSGIESESYVTTPLNMYTVAEQVPMMADVRQGISEIPLAILAADNARAEHMQLAFYLTSNWSRECYVYDSQTGQRIRIMDGLIITIEMPLNHEQRYYIEGPDVYQGSSQGGVTTSTPANNTTTNPNLRAYSLHQGEVTVNASELMTGVKLYDIAGRLLAHDTFDLLQNTATLSAPAGVCVVEAVLRDGTTLHTQTIVR